MCRFLGTLVFLILIFFFFHVQKILIGSKLKLHVCFTGMIALVEINKSHIKITVVKDKDFKKLGVDSIAVRRRLVLSFPSASFFLSFLRFLWLLFTLIDSDESVSAHCIQQVSTTFGLTRSFSKPQRNFLMCTVC